MPKSYEDLMNIRADFEEFEKSMSKNTPISVKKHGLVKTTEVQAEVAAIRSKLHDLTVMMFETK